MGSTLIILLLMVVMLMRVLQSVFNKKAALVLPGGLKPYISYITFSKLLAAVFAFVLVIQEGNYSGINSEALLIASCSGLCLAIGSVCGIKALLGGTVALSSMFGTAGMIIPIILGIFVFNEPVSPLQWLCIAVLFVSVLLLVSSVKSTLKNFSFKTVGYLIGSFVSNGLVMFCQKLFGERQPNGNVAMFSMLTFLVPTVVLAVILGVMCATKAEKQTSAILPKKLVLYSAILAFAVFVIQQVVTMLTGELSGAVLFTVVNGGATVIAAIVGAIMYKEKITVRSCIGIILGIAAMVCIKIFE